MIDQGGVIQLEETVKTVKGLRDMLYNEIDRLRNGEITPKQAQSVARLAENILNSARLEMDAFRHPLSDEFLNLPEHPALEIKTPSRAKRKSKKCK